MHWFNDLLSHCCFIDSSTHYFQSLMIHWFIVSLNHRDIGSLIDGFIESEWFIDSLIDWLVDWLIDSSIHWLTGWLLHWVIASLLHWFIDSWVHCFVHSSLVHRFLGSLIHSFSCTQIFHDISLASQPPFPHALMHLRTSTLHCCSQKPFYRPWISYSHVLCPKLLHRCVLGTIW